MGPFRWFSAPLLARRDRKSIEHRITLSQFHNFTIEACHTKNNEIGYRPCTLAHGTDALLLTVFNNEANDSRSDQGNHAYGLPMKVRADRQANR